MSTPALEVHTQDPVHILSFDLAGRTLALNVAEIVEVLQPAALSPLPQAGSPVEGALDVRGEIVPVFDLRRLLGVEAKRWSRKTRIIIALVSAGKVGLIVDGISQVFEANRDYILPPPPWIVGIDAMAVAGVLRKEEGLVPILSVAKLLQDR